MNSKFLSFPTEDVRDWVEIERTLRANLEQVDAAEQAKSIIIDHMKVYWQMLIESSVELATPRKPTSQETTGKSQ